MKRAFLVHSRDGKLLGRVLAHSDEDAVQKAGQFWEKHNPICTRLNDIEVEPNGETPDVDAVVPVQARAAAPAKKKSKKEKKAVIVL